MGERVSRVDLAGPRGRSCSADSFDLAAQTAQSVADSPHYVTWFMGHNDVCENSFAEIPSDAQFKANARAGLNNLKNGPPNGATIYVLGLVDIYKLRELGDQLTSLGFIDCALIWATTLLDIHPCIALHSPLNSEADRQYTRSRNTALHDILQRRVAEYTTRPTRTTTTSTPTRTSNTNSCRAKSPALIAFTLRRRDRRNCRSSARSSVLPRHTSRPSVCATRSRLDLDAGGCRSDAHQASPHVSAPRSGSTVAFSRAQAIGSQSQRGQNARMTWDVDQRRDRV